MPDPCKRVVHRGHRGRLECRPRDQGSGRSHCGPRDSGDRLRPRLRGDCQGGRHAPCRLWRRAQEGGARSDSIAVRGRSMFPADVKLDLGATAKALAADRAARRVQQAIGGGVLVSLGGDLSICRASAQGRLAGSGDRGSCGGEPRPTARPSGLWGVASRPPARRCAAGPRPTALGTTSSTRRAATPRTRSGEP